MDEVYDRLAFVETQAVEESLYEILRTPLTDPELLAQIKQEFDVAREKG